MARLAINGGSKVLPDGIRVQWPQFDQQDEAALLEVLRSGKWWRGGTLAEQSASVCGRFEREFAAYHDSPHALCVSNGTVALELALRAAGVKAGDEVVVPDLSFVVSASAALPLGAVPVFADCDERTFQMDPEAIAAAITPRTSAIVIVHFGGYPADLDRICRIAEKHQLPLIEDCAHAHGTQWRGKGVGSYGEFGTFSFQNSKSLTCGEGGIILARTAQGRSEIYRYHNLGRREDEGFYDFHTMSSNFRLTDLQGALLRTQFVRLQQQVPARMEAAACLNSLLSEVEGLEPLPEDPRITRQGFYYYLFRFNSEQFSGLSRDRFIEAMKAEGVSIGRTYGTPIHQYPLFQNWKWPDEYPNARYSQLSCPVAERALREQLCSLGHTVLLADQSTLVRIAEAAMKIKEHVSELLEPRPVTAARPTEARAAKSGA